RAHLEAQAQRLSIEAKLGALNRIATEQAGAESVSTSIDDPLIRKLKTEMAELQVQRSKLLQTYKERHPEVLKVDARSSSSRSAWTPTSRRRCGRSTPSTKSPRPGRTRSWARSTGSAQKGSSSTRRRSRTERSSASRIRTSSSTRPFSSA